MVPVVSVMPYIWTKPQPNTSMHSFSSAGGNRRGAVEHVFQPRKVDLARARLPHHELHRGRHHEQFGDSGLLEEVQHLGRIEFPRDDALGAVIERPSRPSRSRRCGRSASPPARRRLRSNGSSRAFRPLPVSTRLKKVGVRQHRALGLAGRARGVELDRDVLPADVDLRVVAALRVAPRRIVRPFRRAAFGGDDGAQVRQLRP